MTAATNDAINRPKLHTLQVNGITMRVADWWRHDGHTLTENWVLIDLPHLMLQMDVDLLAALRD